MSDDDGQALAEDLETAIAERLAERRAEAIRRNAERKALREQLAARRAAGLKARHRQKLERTTTEGDQT